MKYLLVDNGSLRADSVLNLRRVAGLLSGRNHVEVVPASLLHSSKVPKEEIGDVPAVNFERRIKQFLESGERNFTVIPFFFGPTLAILDYMPKRIDLLKEKYGAFTIQRTAFLFDEQLEESNDMLVSILAENIRDTLKANKLDFPKVALVDHGSPVEPVTQIRNKLATLLQTQLQGEIACVEATSMERRPGDQYAFNEPLLEKLLISKDWSESTVIVAMLFLSPGRHAGPGGDVDRICAQARSTEPALKSFMTDLVGTHPLIVDLLSERIKGRRLPLE